MQGSKCALCRDNARKAAARQHERLKAEGLCCVCPGKVKALPGRTLCEFHRLRNNERNARTRADVNKPTKGNDQVTLDDTVEMGQAFADGSTEESEA
jgi:hypothetical protein